MANVPQTTHAGTPVKKTLTITLEVISYVKDPKIVKIGEMENRTVGEVDLSGLVNGLLKGVQSQTGKPCKHYLSSKANMLFISLDRGGTVDDSAEAMEW